MLGGRDLDPPGAAKRLVARLIPTEHVEHISLK